MIRIPFALRFVAVVALGVATTVPAFAEEPTSAKAVEKYARAIAQVQADLDAGRIAEARQQLEATDSREVRVVPPGLKPLKKGQGGLHVEPEMGVRWLPHGHGRPLQESRTRPRGRSATKSVPSTNSTSISRSS